MSGGEGEDAGTNTDPLIGTIIAGRFEVLGFLAKGGMGAVYRARQLPLGRACAVKVMHPALTGDQRTDFHHRFFLEASTAAKLSHPNTVTVFDYGKDDDRYFMAMELLEGRTLRDAIRLEAPFSEARVLHIARQICRSLREAHGMGVIHRDLKPANIFLVQHGDEADQVKVLDFGLVKNLEDTDQQHTQAGICMGSPKYMAPEQVTGQRVDARTDVYALGVLMYEMLTGRVPFDRGNGMTTILAHVSEEVPPMRTARPDLALSADLERVVMRCLAKSADDRYRSMDDVLNALKLSGGVITTTHGEHSRGGTSGSPVVRDLAPHDAPTVSRFSSVAPANAEPPAAGALGPRRARAAAFGGVALAAAATLVFTLAARARDDGHGSMIAAAGAARPGAPTELGARPAADVPRVAASAPGAPEVSAAPVARTRVVSEPPGANVKEDGVEICAATPCDLRYDGADAKRPHRLVLALAGHKPETRTVAPDATAVTVRLARAPAAPQRRRPTPAKEAAPGGYKLDLPY